MKASKTHTLKERFLYWFDNRMSKGSFGLFRILIIASVLVALIIAGLIIALGFSDGDSKLAVFWDSFATLINSWMPYSADGDGSAGYLILMAITAILGVLFTSVLIGIITSAIEERIVELKHGNSKVIESGHTVILGFNPGEYTLINQLILAASGRPGCIVIGENLPREEMEQYISENIEAPKNFKIICRTVDTHDPASIEKCSLETCKSIIVHPVEDSSTIKTVLAVSSLMQRVCDNPKPINAIISRREYGFPPSLAEKNHITSLQTSNTIAKMIAHSCTQSGLSETFREIFNFEGSELYIIDLPDAIGITFAELMIRLDLAVPIGVLNDGGMVLNPVGTYKITEGDRIVIFAENGTSYALASDASYDPIPQLKDEVLVNSRKEANTVIIGYNSSLPIVLKELPENVTKVVLAGQSYSEKAREIIDRVAQKRDLKYEYFEEELLSGDGLLTIAKMAEHIVILNDHAKDDEAADMDTIFLLLNLRELRTSYGFNYNITAEMRLEHNQKLVMGEDHTDFLVTSSMSSLFLAQLSEHPELIGAFSEILSNEGNELYLKSVRDLQCEGEYTIRALREYAFRLGYILLGINDENQESTFNLSLDSTIDLKPEHSLIVLAEK